MRDALGALRERDFRLLFLAHAATAVGDRMAPLALAFAVFEISESASALGLVLAAGTVPTIAFVLAGGVWADRLGRRKVMIASDLTRAAVQGTAAALLISGRAEIWQLVALQAVYGSATAFFLPAVQGLVPQTVSAGRLQQANALLSLARSATGIGGPALAGVLVATAGPGFAIGADGLTFLVSAFFLLRLRVPPLAASGLSFFADLRAGWHEFSGRTWIWASVVNFGLFQFIALSSFMVLGPFVAKTELGGATAWAAITVAASVGAVLGGTLMLTRRPKRPLIAVFTLILLWVPEYVLLAIPAPTAVIAASALVGQVGLAALTAIWFTTLQEHVPPDAVSRVSSYDWLGSLLLLPVGLALVGPVSEAIGVTATLLVAAVWVAASSLAMLAIPSVRGLRRALPETA